MYENQKRENRVCNVSPSKKHMICNSTVRPMDEPLPSIDTMRSDDE